MCSQWHRKLAHINSQTLHPICSSVVRIEKCLIFLTKEVSLFQILLPQIMQTTWDMMTQLLHPVSNCAGHHRPVCVKMTVTATQTVEVTLVICFKMKCKTLHKPWVSLTMSKWLHWQKELFSWFGSKTFSYQAKFSPFQEFIFLMMAIVPVNHGTAHQLLQLVPSTC